MVRKILGLICMLIAISPTLKSQTIETVDVSPAGSSYDTYLTGINNSGLVCGYYNNGSTDIAFVINALGKLVEINPSQVGATSTRAEGINDSGVIVMTATGGSNDFYKVYLDEGLQEISAISVLQNVYQSTSKPQDINNNNDVAGWYQSVQRWLYVQHDSIVPVGNSAWEANRYSTPGPVYYQTQAFGINDANKVVGFYINGTVNEAFVYDNLAGTFTPLPYSYNKVEMYDINNSNWVVGRYRQNNNVYMGFLANVATGSITQFNSLDNIFHDPSIQSEAKAINDSKDIAGSFYHPGTNKWVGFIYHPDINQYQIPAFNYSQHTWSLVNNKDSAWSVWTINYWGGQNYYSNDPYINDGQPLVNWGMQGWLGNGQYFVDSYFPTWRAYAEEFDQYDIPQNPQHLQQYYTIIRPALFSVYKQISFREFPGLCYGFSNSALMSHFLDSTYSEWFGTPINLSLPQVPNTDVTAIKSIERMQLKQHNEYMTIYHNPEKMDSMETNFAGLMRLKNTFRLPFTISNPSSMSLKFRTQTQGGVKEEGHNVLPYKIRTPQKLPFDYNGSIAYDTVFIYDSNRPGDSSQVMYVRAVSYYDPHDSVMSPLYQTKLVKASFNNIGVRELLYFEHSGNKSTSGPVYKESMMFSLLDSCDFTISGNGGSLVTLDNSGYNSNTTDISVKNGLNTGEVNVFSHIVDTNYSVNIHTSNYIDSSMLYIQSNGTRSMGMSRSALPGEQDNSSQSNRMIAYGNPDNTTKYLNAMLIEHDPSTMTGANISASNICAEQGDSIVTMTPSPYVYIIKKVTGNATCSYTLDIYTGENGDVTEFHTQVSLSPNTTHTIDPFFGSTLPKQIAVIVDNGNDGNADDTLFITGFPLGVHSSMPNPGIRVYPNPSSELVNIKLQASHIDKIVSIYNTLGQRLLSDAIPASQSSKQMQISSLTPGLYILEISDSEGRNLFTTKLVKE